MSVHKDDTEDCTCNEDYEGDPDIFKDEIGVSCVVDDRNDKVGENSYGIKLTK